MNSLDKCSDFNKEILYSREVRSGRRIYYLDIKQNRGGELFIAMTESKKILGKPEQPEVRFEKHKLFLYQDDIPDFMDALNDLTAYIARHRGQAAKARPFVAEEAEEDLWTPGNAAPDGEL